MDILEKSPKRKILELLATNIDYFASFKNVYLFGSIVKEEKTSEDIDLLIIYTKYTEKILNDVNNLIKMFESNYDVTFDLTIMSVQELEEVGILDKLLTKYIVIK